MIPQRSETIRDKIEEATNSTRPTSSGLVPKIAASSCRKVLPGVPTFVRRASYQGESRSKSSAFPLLLPQSKSLGSHMYLWLSPRRAAGEASGCMATQGFFRHRKGEKRATYVLWSTQLPMLPVTAQKSPEVIVVSG